MKKNVSKSAKSDPHTGSSAAGQAEQTEQESPLLTLDQTIEKLLALKAAGVPGHFAVMRPGVDNNGRSGFMQRIEFVGMTSVAKAEFEKGWNFCKKVSSRGVDVVMIS